MFILLIIVHVIVCVTLIAVILLQAGKGHGLAGSSFGSEMNSVFGSQTATFMSKATTVAAVLFIVTCLGIDIYISSQGKSLLGGDAEVTEAQMQDLLEKIKIEQEAKDAVAEVSDVVEAEDGIDV